MEVGDVRTGDEDGVDAEGLLHRLRERPDAEGLRGVVAGADHLHAHVFRRDHLAPRRLARDVEVAAEVLRLNREFARAAGADAHLLPVRQRARAADRLAVVDERGGEVLQPEIARQLVVVAVGAVRVERQVHAVKRHVAPHGRRHHVVHAVHDPRDAAAPRDAVVHDGELRARLRRRLDEGDGRVDAEGDLRHVVPRARDLHAVVRDVRKRLHVQDLVDPLCNPRQFHGCLRLVPACGDDCAA